MRHVIIGSPTDKFGESFRVCHLALCLLTAFLAAFPILHRNPETLPPSEQWFVYTAGRNACNSWTKSGLSAGNDLPKTTLHQQHVLPPVIVRAAHDSRRRTRRLLRLRQAWRNSLLVAATLSSIRDLWLSVDWVQRAGRRKLTMSNEWDHITKSENRGAGRRQNIQGLKFAKNISSCSHVPSHSHRSWRSKLQNYSTRNGTFVSPIETSVIARQSRAVPQRR